MRIGKLGVWTAQTALSAADAAAQARRVEAWGYGALWHPEPASGRNVLAHAGLLLSQTTSLVVATGIASIYARDAITGAAGQLTLAEASEGRFLLGLGVSHVAAVRERGQVYGKPLESLRAYLEAMAAASVAYRGPRPAETPPTLIAALGPKMLELGAELADGVHSYNVTPEHTATARRILGPGKLLCPEQMVLLETDPDKAREAARARLSISLRIANYRANWLRQGFTDEDLDGRGSDRLVDGMVAWGDEDAIRARLQAHWDAGADHVCIQVVSSGTGAPAHGDERILELLAPART